MSKRLIALSAAYGAGGRFIGIAVASRLEVPFVDRAITRSVAGRLDVTLDEALAHEEPPSRTLLERLLASFASADAGTPVTLPADGATVEDFHAALAEAVREQAAAGEGVILGRGGVAALREDPRALRVRLSGPVPGRLARAMAVTDVDEATARRTLRRLDRTQAAYLQQFHGVDIDDPGLYHLTIDSTAMPLEACVDLIERAATAVS
ncbi:MAG: cytidylate kinase-like family protein [Solirubrobacterales bacterium]|nr:cytidylate kinase-like family protein [Solirubrobacterales bacterium]